VELKLKKRVPGKWDKLEGDGAGSAAQFNTATAAPKSVYSGSQRDWGSIDADLKKKEDEEKPEGEEARRAVHPQRIRSAGLLTPRAPLELTARSRAGAEQAVPRHLRQGERRDAQGDEQVVPDVGRHRAVDQLGRGQR